MRTINFFKSPKNTALLSLVVVFMALIRIMAECLWLGVWQTRPAPLNALEPFLYAAFITSLTGFALALLTHYQKYIAVIVLAVLDIAALVVIKIACNI